MAASAGEADWPQQTEIGTLAFLGYPRDLLKMAMVLKGLQERASGRKDYGEERGDRESRGATKLPFAEGIGDTGTHCVRSLASKVTAAVAAIACSNKDQGVGNVEAIAVTSSGDSFCYDTLPPGTA